MHPRLLLDVIQRQAGSLAKAVMEAIQNSADACLSGRVEGPFCEVEISGRHLIVTDNGVGITSRKHIEQFFETFGQPHAEEEGKTYGTFRMGRGQCFAYGVNRWYTGEFEMEVDVKNKGLDYTLRSGLKHKPGCMLSILLYDPLDDYDLNRTIRDVKLWAKYIPIRVMLNGERISIDPESEKDWDVITDDAYIRFKSGGSGLEVYNLGAHVTNIPNYRLGVGGELVTRKQLKVNFARNDIQSDCPVWVGLKDRIKDYVNEQAGRPDRKINMAEAESIITRAIAGKWPDKFSDMKLFPDVNGRMLSGKILSRMLTRKTSRNLGFAPKGDTFADRAMKNGSCVALDSSILDWTGGYDKLLTLLDKACGIYTSNIVRVTAEDMRKGVSGDFVTLPDSELTDNEKAWMDLLQGSSYEFRKTTGESFEDRRYRCRACKVGRSDVADAWTNGRDYVAFNRSFLAKQPFHIEGITRVMTVYAHEVSHEIASTETMHGHSLEFYELFHKLCVEVVPLAVKKAVNRLPATLERISKSKGKTARKDLERLQVTMLAEEQEA